MDNKTKRGPQDAQRVNINEDYEVTYWAAKFGVSANELKAAVEKVGVMANDVEAALKQR